MHSVRSKHLGVYITQRLAIVELLTYATERVITAIDTVDS